MAIQDVLAAEIDEAATDRGRSASSEASDDRAARGGPSPFSMDYELDEFDSLDAKDVNNLLTALVAVTNLI